MARPGFLVRFWRGLLGGAAPPKLPVDSDFDVVIHVARHLAGREQMTTRHLLHALLQNEEFAELIARAGGTAEAIADSIPATTEDRPQWRVESEAETRMRAQAVNAGGDAAVALGRAITIANRGGQLPTCADLWAYLSRTDAGIYVERAGVDPTELLFLMTHGVAEQDLSTATGRVVHVVLRNDPYTRTELVAQVLREVFELTEQAALETMKAAETNARAVVGRFDAARARTLVLAGRALARAAGFPLWLGIEDC